MTDQPAPPDIYLRHLAVVTGGSQEQLRDIWEPEGVVEFPFARNIGREVRLAGIDAITTYFTQLGLFSAFTFSDWHVMSDVAGVEWVVEVHGSAQLSSGAAYEQDYITRFGLSQRGRMAWMREYWDPTRF